MESIKLRAWDSINKKMHDHRNINVIVKNLNINRGGKQQWIYMLGSGMSDKNGDEIFSGDILKHNIIGRMVCLYSAYWGGFVFEKKGWLWPRKNHYGINALELEIIGNYYENPDLANEVLN